MRGVFTFERATPERKWTLKDSPRYEGNNLVHICNVDKYVNVPADALEFNAVFTDVRPPGQNYFEFTRYNQIAEDKWGLATDDRIAWYDSTRSWMQEIYAEGYRYLSVEY